jgi:thiamine monophosphate synthase
VQAGADGVAVVSAVTRAKNIKTATQQFRRALKAARGAA